MKMNWFSASRVSVLITLVTGIYLHLSRLIFGINLTLEKLVTIAFDSVFAFVLNCHSGHLPCTQGSVVSQ